MSDKVTISNLQTVNDLKMVELGQLEPQISVILLSNPDSTATIEEIRGKIKSNLADFSQKISQTSKAKEATNILYHGVIEEILKLKVLLSGNDLAETIE